MNVDVNHMLQMRRTQKYIQPTQGHRTWKLLPLNPMVLCRSQKLQEVKRACLQSLVLHFLVKEIWTETVQGPPWCRSKPGFSSHQVTGHRYLPGRVDFKKSTSRDPHNDRRKESMSLIWPTPGSWKGWKCGQSESLNLLMIWRCLMKMTKMPPTKRAWSHTEADSGPRWVTSQCPGSFNKYTPDLLFPHLLFYLIGLQCNNCEVPNL